MAKQIHTPPPDSFEWVAGALLILLVIAVIICAGGQAMI